MAISDGEQTHIDAILNFWFVESEMKQWFVKDPEFDATIVKRFANLYEQAANDELDHWCALPDGTLALVILLDQFSRNMFRGDAKTFASDAKALAICKAAIEKGFDAKVADNQRNFLYLPFEHSEELADQVRAVELIAAMGNKELLKWAEKHKVIIERFGRFPHRNEVLGRPSTEAEKQFLGEDGSSF